MFSLPSPGVLSGFVLKTKHSAILHTTLNHLALNQELFQSRRYRKIHLESDTKEPLSTIEDFS